MILRFLTLLGITKFPCAKMQPPGFKVRSGNQKVGLDTIFKHLVRYPCGGWRSRINSWICKSRVQSWRKFRRPQPRHSI